jgi:hypothetical protein
MWRIIPLSEPILAIIERPVVSPTNGEAALAIGACDLLDSLWHVRPLVR